MRLRGPSTESAAQFIALRNGATVALKQRRLPPIKPSPPQRPPQQPRHEQMPITRQQIKRLRSEAGQRGDRFFAGVCARALRGESEAINACKAAVYGLA